ncbi:MAG: DUF1573 domain-containing protein [Thermoguttaceae bacterium]|nr:DUF1573 domain-containing protein [Thermoguttaceae bacterium]
MRAIIATVLGALFFGGALGFCMGKYQAAQRPWTPSDEVNKLAENAKEKAKKSDAPLGIPVPRAKVGELSFDFGILEKSEANEKGEHPFYIENAGNADLTLADGGKGCFCTSFTISKSTLKPGEKATVLFKWDGARSGGVFDQGVRVLTNDEKMKEIFFTVRGLYTAPIVGDPNELNFQNASSSEETTRTFRLLGFEKNDDGTPFPLEITGVDVDNPDLLSVEFTKDDVANLTESDRAHKLFSKATSVFQGVAVLKAGAPNGAFQEVVRIKTNSPKTPILEIIARGQVSGGGVKVVGRRYDDKNTGFLVIDNVSQRTGASEIVRLIFNKTPANENTVKVKSVRPDWLKVDFKFPPEELQKASPARIVETTVAIPAGSPQGAFMGPNKEQLGEIVLTVGEDEANLQEIVLPVRFAVGP